MPENYFETLHGIQKITITIAQLFLYVFYFILNFYTDSYLSQKPLK